MTKPTSPTLKEIRDTHAWKREYERYLPLSRYVFRPLGFLLTWLAIRIGLTTEVVSWLSGFVALMGYLCLISIQENLLPIGISLLIFFNLLDCVDGSIARSMKTENPYGSFLDSLMGWVDMGFWALIGIMAYRHPQLLCWPNTFNGEIVWLIIGGVTSYTFVFVGYIEGIFDKALREDWDKVSDNSKSGAFKNSVKENKDSLLSFILNVIRRINQNMKARETYYFFLILAYWGRVVDLLLVFFLFYYFLHTIFLIIIYSNRGRKIRLKYYA